MPDDLTERVALAMLEAARQVIDAAGQAGNVRALVVVDTRDATEAPALGSLGSSPLDRFAGFTAAARVTAEDLGIELAMFGPIGQG